MTEQPTTAAGQALLTAINIEGVHLPAVKRAILAIEAEARQQDDLALRLLERAIPLLEDEWIGTREDSIGNEWLRDAHAILAALPPSAPPAHKEWKRIPMSDEGRAALNARLAAEPHPVDRIPWSSAPPGLDVERLAKALDVLSEDGLEYDLMSPEEREDRDDAAEHLAAAYALLHEGNSDQEATE